MIDAIQAELTKTFTLRSIQAALVAALIAPPALALASGLAFDPASPAAAALQSEAQGFETAGFGQPLVILLAALIVGSEYLDGSLRTTLLATPQRGRLFAAKLVVIAGLAALIGAIAMSAAVLLKRAALAEHGLAVTGFTPGITWNLVTVTINYTLIALIAAAITALARSFIVTLVVLVPLVLGLTISLVGMLPLLKFLPDLAGIQLLTSYRGVGLLDPLPGGLVMGTWAVLFTSAAAFVFVRRDTGNG